MNLFISCGEVSGDLYAADFISEVLRQEPQLRGNVWGMMGPKAEAACGEWGDWPHWSYEELKIMGIAEVIPALPRLLRLRRSMVQAVLERGADAVVLVDCPDYHLALAALLRRAGYRGRVVSLIPPTVWAWRSGRVKNLKRDFDLCLPLFSFEHRYLLEHGARSLWAAHPLVWGLMDCRAPDELKRRFEGQKLIAIMPGSRRYDIRYHLDTLLGTARLLKEVGYLPVFSVAPGLSSGLAEALRVRVSASGFDFWEGEGRELMSASSAVAGVSGTVAVEAMLLQRFMVVIYNLNRVTYALLRAMVRVRHISIPNILAETALLAEGRPLAGKGASPQAPGVKPLFPELLCAAATPENIVEELRRYLESPEEKAEKDRRLELARGAMGDDCAPAFWARHVLEEIRRGR